MIRKHGHSGIETPRRSRGRRLGGLALLVLMAVAGSLTGCQCCPKTTDCASTVVDHIADNGPKLDCLYSPCYDLTRIGMSDWCECRTSRWFCHGCCPDCD